MKDVKAADSFIFERTGHKVRNRSVLAAMTNKQSHKDGTISDDEIKWLVRRAKDGFGLITTAAANVSEDGKGWEGEIGIYSDKHIKRLSVLTDQVHNYNCLIFSQLFHGGMRAPEVLTGKAPISPNKIKCKESLSGFSVPASNKDIVRIIEDFTFAAKRSVDAGFDGIELHGAHGYLISQFLGRKTNFRTDQWGGSLENRSKFLIEIYRSIKKSVPDSFLVGVRISPELKSVGISLNDSIQIATLLRDEGVDFIHLSCWDCFASSIEFPENSKRLTEWFTDQISDLPPIISTGNIWSTSDANNVINQGADLIGVARSGIAYPDWGKNLHDKEYDPKRGPFSVRHLKDADLSDTFINYMRNWENFVER